MPSVKTIRTLKERKSEMTAPRAAKQVRVINITPKSPPGEYQVHTASGSKYHVAVDNQQSHLVRHPGESNRIKSNVTPSRHRDHEQVDLHDFKAEVGSKAQFLLQREGGGVTVRQTTEVVSINRL